jgi:hypothetical protein
MFSFTRIRAAVAGAVVVGAVALVPSAAQAYSTPTQSCTFTPYKYCVNDNGSPLKRTNSADIGAGKHVTSAATEYRNGLLMLDSYSKNDNWWYGMRPKTLRRRRRQPGPRDLGLQRVHQRDAVRGHGPELRQPAA